MPKSLLTPTQKAKFTGTFFIRCSFWTPSGSRIDLEMPWVAKYDGDQLLARMAELCAATHEGRTNEEWEAIAATNLGKDIARRKKARKQ